MEAADEPRGEYLWASRIIVLAARNSSGRYQCHIFANETNETLSGDLLLQVYCTFFTSNEILVLATIYNLILTILYLSDGRNNLPRLQSLVKANAIGENQLLECEVAEALPAALIMWQTNNGSSNQWLNVSKVGPFRNASFKTRVCNLSSIEIY